MNLRSLTTLCLLLSALLASAQYDPSRINKKAVEAYQKALVKIDESKWSDAVDQLNEAVRRDPNYLEAYVSLAGVHSQLKDRRRSIENYEKAFAIDSSYLVEIRLPYAIALAGNGQFEKALAIVTDLATRPKISNATRKAAEYRQKSFGFAVEHARTHPDNYVFNPRNLGPGVNSPDPEYFPSITIDGDNMIYTRRIGGRNEDFFLSQRAGGTWGASHHLTGSINTPQNEGAQNVSQDGNWLIFTGCHRPGGAGSCDLYISYREKEGWSEPINLGPNINTDQWESQPCLSPDKKDLYFVSRRFGGLGGADIYVSHQLANGRWSAPENLGPNINTPGDEFTPFVHADNNTLYFASDGLPGYGNKDLFVVRRSADGQWGTPENLGYPINTIDEESALAIASDAVTAYYASDRPDGLGSLDIYSFDMRPSMRPGRTLWVQGRVHDAQTKAGLPSTVALIDLKTGFEQSRLQTDETGQYLVTLPLGKDYVFNVNRKGYLFYSDQFLLREKTSDSTYRKDIPLQPIEVNASVVLRNIFFDVKQYELRPESQVELDRLVQFLRDNPTVRIQIEGHTDNVGKPADNQKLSEFRARAVMQYLNRKAIKNERVTAKGFGEAQPVAPNTTDAGRAQNRRTEVKIVAK
ncbi:OmpA family protein [Flaviaesturariibacter amylovorans]|uniref:OmpA-like domain-containing protein n=1 Tax=Flaviaesturariibacter amylovorans TaxID=1084520 RepID=A0ABP8G956_9BACT